MFTLSMLRMSSLWTTASTTTRSPVSPLSKAVANTGLHSGSVATKLPEHPTEPSGSPIGCVPGLPAEKESSSATATAPGSWKQKAEEAQPYFSVCEEVRTGSKAQFVKKRNELQSTWPEFNELYASYRRWRDCKTTDPDYGRIATAGKNAQEVIMVLSGAPNGEKNSLYSLLKTAGDSDELLRYVSPITGDFRAPEAGLVAGLRYTKVGEGKDAREVPILSFPGTGSGQMIRGQMRTNIRQFLGRGSPPDSYQLAEQLATRLKNGLPQDSAPSLTLVGHSLGGGVASFAAAANDLHCYSYNPAALGGASIDYLTGKGKLGDEQRTKQTIIRVKNDHVSSNAMQSRLASVLKRLLNSSFKTPKHIGEAYTIPREELPEQHRGLLKLHQMRSLMGLYHQWKNKSAPEADPSATV